ncbi:MAG: prepilin-type N-terminal cleavage/methylation domain-containing protein [Thermoleophilaceae bacterium]
MRTLHARIRPDAGFTIIEILIVVLILGILATIAVPAFLGEQDKGLDVDAQSNARTVVMSVESCFAETKSYETCDTVSELEEAEARPGVELTDTTAQKKGAVAVIATPDSYTVTGYSKSDNTFVIAKAADGTSTQNW